MTDEGRSAFDPKNTMRVLVVSPHFPPTNAADMQRVRLVVPHLRSQGVEAEVLCVESDQVAAPRDGWLAVGMDADVAVHRVQGLGLTWGRFPGLGTLAFRALGALGRRGDELLGGLQQGTMDGGQGFDLIYFSTTQFGLHVLGPRWKRKFGVPFAMDYQDPWVSDYYREHPEVVPPGGQLKYGVASWISRRQEPQVLRECSGITSVSAAYPEQLLRRYGGREIGKQKWEGGNDRAQEGEVEQSAIRQFQFSAFKSQLFSTVLPFPGDVRDFERVKEEDIVQSVFDPNDGLKHWVYVGRGGADMGLAVRALFSALATTKAESGNWKADIKKLRLHFIGTSYAATGKGQKTIEPLAAEYGLQDIVTEHPDRIPYSETLRCLLDADALMIPGSDDPGYTASKIYPYLLAGKPLLAVFHEQSSVTGLMRQVGGGSIVSFATGESPEAIGQRITHAAFDEAGGLRQVSLDHDAFSPHTARHQAKDLAAFFHHCLCENGNPPEKA